MNPRIAIKVAMAAMPDDRVTSRWRVMRSAVTLIRSGQTKLPRPFRRRMMSDLGKMQRFWVSLGVTVFLLAYQYPVRLVAFLVAVPLLSYQIISSVVKGLL